MGESVIHGCITMALQNHFLRLTTNEGDLILEVSV
jgi:hypothetical protein